MKAIKNILAGLAVATIAAAGYAYDVPENIYLVGDATANGWHDFRAIPMTKGENNTFVWEGRMNPTGECQFKFLGQQSWDPIKFRAKVAGTPITTAETQTFPVVYGGDDYKWKVEDAGYYRLTLALDPSKPDDEAGTLTVNYLGKVPSEIYMLGAAPNTWSANEAIAITGENGVFTWTGNINYYGEDKQIKFCLGRGEWYEVYYIVPNEVNHNGNVLQVEPGTYTFQESSEVVDNALKDWFWGIKPGQSGEYKVTVNLNDNTVKFELVNLFNSFDKNNVTSLYMLGLGVNQFASNDAVEMTSLGDGKFEWRGTLNHATDDGDANHANKQFKFVTSQGEYNQVYHLVPVNADQDGYIEAIEPGEHNMKMCTWIDGQTGVDAFYGLTPGKSGNYIVTADVPNMKVTLAEDTNTGIEGIAAETEGVEEAYDLNGVKVNLQNAPAGVYIVRKGGTAKKVMVK